jgi:mannose-6-phosphate isomerase-like protein (cupin superfamily)
MTFCSPQGRPWMETLPTQRGARFTGRTFCRFHLSGDSRTLPSVAEIWATSDHAVDEHAHDSDEMLCILSGTIEVNGQILRLNEAVFIPRGETYRARVVSAEGGHVLRVAFPNAAAVPEPAEYDARPWPGPLTQAGFPDLGNVREEVEPRPDGRGAEPTVADGTAKQEAAEAERLAPHDRPRD